MKKLTKTLISLAFGVTLLISSGFVTGSSLSADGFSQQGGKVIWPPSEGTA
ncbi:hypothetical protein [Jeotgalibacillus sp. S-D1]|uniref:hypothetical protein n=1 Tax=Jeotgalibacillus sp. S-D1 TaxID=2552189 RepID=UPI001404E030|nr:hypothetical protein [Jeotgalibacillus sp. S-D1]